MSTDTLPPLDDCPFCGCKHMNIVVDMSGFQAMWEIVCQGCSVTTSRYDCQSEVIEAWNTRAHPQGWQDISTAPKDGTQFLIWTVRLGFAVVRHDVDDPMPTDIVPSGHRLLVDDGKFGPYQIRGDYPTHWMHLPAKPAAQPAPSGEEAA